MKNPEFTYFMDIYEYIDINDIRLKKQFSENPALYLYRMWGYLKPGMTKFVQPKGMQNILRHNVPPEFQYLQIESDGIKNEFTIAPDMDIVAVLINGEKYAVFDSENLVGGGNLISYNKEEGKLTFKVTQSSKDEVESYAYKDGYFKTKLDNTAQDILGQCISLKWWQRDVTSDWLRTAPKLQDKNSKTGSAWQAENADTERTRFLESLLSDKMQSYEQELDYLDKVPSNRQLWNRIG